MHCVTLSVWVRWYVSAQCVHLHLHFRNAKIGKKLKFLFRIPNLSPSQIIWFQVSTVLIENEVKLLNIYYTMS